MNIDRRRALMALTVAGLLWGSTVPLSKIALGWLAPGWLTAIRFAVAAAVLLAITRPRGRGAWSPAVLAWGAAGYGGTVLLQNTGITRTSVSHAALLIGTAPVMVAIIAVVWHRSVVRPVAWAGFAVSLGGVGLIAAGGGGGSNLGGDGMVLASVLLSAVFTVGQTRLLRGRDPIAVTAVQFLGAALVTAPFSALTESPPSAPAHLGSLLAVAALIAGGTLVPFTLFAFGQSLAAGRDRRRLPQHRAAGRRGGGRRGLREPGRPGSAQRGCGHPRRHRAEQRAAARPPPGPPGSRGAGGGGGGAGSGGPGRGRGPPPRAGSPRWPAPPGAGRQPRELHG